MKSRGEELLQRLGRWKCLRAGSIEREITDRVHDYWRLQSGDALSQAVELIGLPEMTESSATPTPELPIALYLDGWIHPAHRKLLSQARLQVANPGGVFRVRSRQRRADVGTALGKRFRRTGFSVEAYLPKFPSRFFDLGASPSTVILGSTPPTVQFLAHVLPQGASAENQQIPALTLDGVRLYDVGVTDPLGRMAFLAPEELTLTLRASGDRDLAGELAKRFGNVPSLSEWCDRWAFIAGSDESLHPHRRTVTIMRKFSPGWNDPAAPAIPFPVMMPGPGRLVPAVPGTEPIRDYPLETAQIEDCWIQNGGTVFTDNDLILLDRMADPRHERGDEVYIDVYGAAARGDSALLLQAPDSGEAYDEAVFIGGRHDFNWYHWIVEYLPRLLDLDAQVDADLPILISSRVPANGLRALESLTSRQVQRLPTGARARVKRLHLASPAMGVPDNYLSRWPRILHADTGCLLRFREEIFDKTGGTAATPPEKVFLKRTTAHRKLANQDELQALAEAHGFTTVQLEKLDFCEQVALFRGARVVVGGSGAAMANYLFSGPQTRVIDLVSRHNIDSPLPALICAVGGADFAYLYGDAERRLAECRSLHEARHADFRVEPADLARQLRA